MKTPKEILRKGYLSISEYAKSKGITRQAVHKRVRDGKHMTMVYKGRVYVWNNEPDKLNINQNFDEFKLFGFENRGKSLLIGNDIIVDVKATSDPDKVSIRFYKDDQMLLIIADLTTVEIIKDSGY